MNKRLPISYLLALALAAVAVTVVLNSQLGLREGYADPASDLITTGRQNEALCLADSPFGCSSRCGIAGIYIFHRSGGRVNAKLYITVFGAREIWTKKWSLRALRAGTDSILWASGPAGFAHTSSWAVYTQYLRLDPGVYTAWWSSIGYKVVDKQGLISCPLNIKEVFEVGE